MATIPSARTCRITDTDNIGDNNENQAGITHKDTKHKNHEKAFLEFRFNEMLKYPLGIK